MSDQEIYEAVIRYSSTLPVPENLRGEFQEAINLGITDGSNPGKLVPRYQAAVMAKRVSDKIIKTILKALAEAVEGLM